MVAFQRDLTLLLGDDLWKDLEPEFARINSLRKEMVQVQGYRTDAAQLRKFKDLFLE